MMLVDLLCSYIIFGMVASNPIYQTPTQCLQNGFSNPANFLSPIPSYNQPYTAEYIAQNANPIPAQTSFNNQMKRLMATILSKPELQAILSPNTFHYATNALENQMTNFPYHVTPNQPRVVNNYIILASDCSKANETIPVRQKTKCAKNDIKRFTAKRKSNKKSKQLGNKEANPAKEGSTEEDKPKSKTRDKKKLIRNETYLEVTNTPSEKFEELDRIISSTPTETIPETTTNFPIDTDTFLNTHQDVNNQTISTKKRKKKSKVQNVLNENPNKSMKAISRQSTGQNSVVNTNHNEVPPVSFDNVPQEYNKKQNKGSDSKNTRKPTNFVDAINSKGPNEYQNMMSYMNSYFNNQQLGNYDIFRNLPFSYDQFYPQLREAGNYGNKKNKSKIRKSQRKTKRRKKPNNTDSENIDNKNHKITEDNIVTTISPSNYLSSNEVTTLTDKVLDITTELPHEMESPDYTSDYGAVTENMNEFDYANEDTGPMNEMNDYYPDFTDSAAYFATNNEHYIKNLPHRYYYRGADEVDRPTKESKYEMRIHPSPVKERGPYSHRHKDSDRKAIKYYTNTYEITTSRSFSANLSLTESSTENEIQFRTPPVLEFPDFETKKLNKDVIRTETFYRLEDKSDKHLDYGDKASFYSNAKTPMYTDSRPSKQKTDIETVFAHSKVVKYGQMPNEVDDVTTSTNKPDVTDRIAPTIPAIIFAESFDYPEY